MNGSAARMVSYGQDVVGIRITGHLAGVLARTGGLGNGRTCSGIHLVPGHSKVIKDSTRQLRFLKGPQGSPLARGLPIGLAGEIGEFFRPGGIWVFIPRLTLWAPWQRGYSFP